MLRKETEPLSPAVLLPFTCIKEQLTFVNDQQDRAFLGFGSDFLLAQLDQVFGGHKVIGAIGEISSFVLAEIHLEVTDDRVTKPGPVDDCPGTMQALTGAGRTAVKADHINHRSS